MGAGCSEVSAVRAARVLGVVRGDAGCGLRAVRRTNGLWHTALGQGQHTMGATGRS